MTEKTKTQKKLQKAINKDRRNAIEAFILQKGSL
jgi:hypothetical protein